MIRPLVLIALVVILGAGPARAQSVVIPPTAPRLTLQTILSSSNVTDEQKAQIRSAMEQQRPTLQEAVTSGRPHRAAAVLQKVLTVLTSEQRHAIRAAVQEQLKHFNERAQPQ